MMDSHRGGTNQSSARLELKLDAQKALILGSKLGSGSKGLGSSSIQFWKFRLGPTPNREQGSYVWVFATYVPMSN